jgi:hypothetical protein
MKNCKNTECTTLIDDKKTYCSLRCRNIFVNKNLRDYKKNSVGLSKEKNYETTKKICLNPNCGKELPYKKRKNKYCSKSCSVTIINTERTCTWGHKISQGIKKHIENNVILKVKTCKFCGEKINGRLKYCGEECRKNFKRRNTNEFQKYKLDSRFKFNLADYPSEFDFSLIEKYGWYKPTNKGNNLSGVSRDHKISIVYGFTNNIDSKIISHPANCQLMKHSENISKHKGNSITIEELINQIKIWDIKYKKGD